MIDLHRDALVTNDDIVSARVIPTDVPGQFNVAARFTEAAGEKLRAATAAHIGGLVALLIDGNVALAPTLGSAFSRDALLTGNYTKDEADRIANGMMLSEEPWISSVAPFLRCDPVTSVISVICQRPYRICVRTAIRSGDGSTT